MRAVIRVGRFPQAVAVGAGAVWVADRHDGTVRRIDPRTNRVAGGPIQIVEPDAAASSGLGNFLSLGVYRGQVWVFDFLRPAVVLIDPRTHAATVHRIAKVPVAGFGPRVAPDRGLLWLFSDEAVGRVRLSDGRKIGGLLSIDTFPNGAAAYAGSAWVTTLNGSIARIAP